MLVALEPADEGEITFAGSVVRPGDKTQMRSFRQQVQIIFQDPYSSLNPRSVLAGAFSEVLLVHGMSDRGQRARRVGELLDLVGLRAEVALRYPRELSRRWAAPTSRHSAGPLQ